MPKEPSSKHKHSSRHHHHDRKKDRKKEHKEGGSSSSSKSSRRRDNSKQDIEDGNDILEQLQKLAKEHNKREGEKTMKKKKKNDEHGKSDQSLTPMTKEDYEKQRSIIRTELDPETGRMRRVRATGEILESIVSKEEHHRINKLSTMNDGLSYSQNILRRSMN